MKRLSSFSTIILLFLLVLVLAFAPKSRKYEKFNLAKLDETVVKIADSLYAGKYEVSNNLYISFIEKLDEIKDLNTLAIALPDTLNWRFKYSYQEPMVDYYFRHPAYSNYPVVNVSYEAANLFCKWLTEQYNLNPKRKFKKVIFRIPTEFEWLIAAKAGEKFSPYPWGIRLQQNGKFNCNFMYVGDENIKFDTLKNNYNVVILGEDNDNCLRNSGNPTAPVDSYEANKFGLFNVCGNVAEMVQEKGIACGGGWKSVGGDVTLQSKSKYEKSAVDVGFRYFMEIIEK